MRFGQFTGNPVGLDSTSDEIIKCSWCRRKKNRSEFYYNGRNYNASIEDELICKRCEEMMANEQKKFNDWYFDSSNPDGYLADYFPASKDEREFSSEISKMAKAHAEIPEF